MLARGGSTWGHPQPEVISPSLTPLVFERFLPILTLWLSPNSHMVLLNAEKLSEVRRRLSDISWWMGCKAETIARQANKEDQTTDILR